MLVINVSIPVVVTGKNLMGWPSFSAVQSGDKVRVFTETGKDGKPRPSGRPQLRITTFGQIGDSDPSPIEIVGLVDHEVWDVLEVELLAAAPVVNIEISGVVQMNGDKPDRVKVGSKSWIAGSMIINLIGVSASKGKTSAASYKRAKPEIRASVSSSLD